MTPDLTLGKNRDDSQSYWEWMNDTKAPSEGKYKSHYSRISASMKSGVTDFHSNSARLCLQSCTSTLTYLHTCSYILTGTYPLWGRVHWCLPYWYRTGRASSLLYLAQNLMNQLTSAAELKEWNTLRTLYSDSGLILVYITSVLAGMIHTIIYKYTDVKTNTAKNKYK